MSKLASRSALQGIAVPGRYGAAEREAGVMLTERANLGLATVAARKGQGDRLKAAVREVYGLDLPSGPSVVHGKDASFMGTGPGEWFAISEHLANEALAEDLSGKLEGLASVSDQSSGRAVVRVSGPRARDVLAKGLAVDLDPRVFPSGSAATSTISHMGVVLWRGGDGEDFDIALFRSVSESFWRWLTSSAAEFGYEVAASRM